MNPTTIRATGSAWGNVLASCELDFSTLKSELGLTDPANAHDVTKVGGFIKSDVEDAMKKAGYIDKTDCPVNGGSGGGGECPLWNSLATSMTVATCLLVVVIACLVAHMMRRGRLATTGMW